MGNHAPIFDLLGMAKKSRASVLGQISRLVSPSHDARELFLGEDGKLKPAAARLLARLAIEAGMHRIEFEPDARRQDYRLGQQHIVRHMAAMLEIDQIRLAQLQKELGEAR